MHHVMTSNLFWKKWNKQKQKQAKKSKDGYHLLEFDEHVLILTCVYGIYVIFPHWGRQLLVFGYISYLDTYIWIACGLLWVVKQILRKHVL